MPRTPPGGPGAKRLRQPPAGPGLCEGPHRTLRKKSSSNEPHPPSENNPPKNIPPSVVSVGSCQKGNLLQRPFPVNLVVFVPEADPLWLKRNRAVAARGEVIPYPGVISCCKGPQGIFESEPCRTSEAQALSFFNRAVFILAQGPPVRPRILILS